MSVSYGLFGVFAAFALILNGGMIIGALSALQATLTLPGIAGIVLTIGMAVDANVLIFERIREELSIGQSPVAAIDSGYRRALSSIIDSQVTTLIAAVILFAMGSGPIRGFSVTLTIGIITSLFTAIFLTRLMVGDLAPPCATPHQLADIKGRDHGDYPASHLRQPPEFQHRSSPEVCICVFGQRDYRGDGRTVHAWFEPRH